MGGQLLKTWGLPERRLSLEDFMVVNKRVMDKLLDRGFVAAVPDWIQEKKDFGDLDVLVSVDGDKEREALFHTVIDELSDFKPHVNGSVASVPIDGFQVDFIMIEDRSFDFAYNYYSNNDFGNLMGRFARGKGLRLGHHGLWFELRESFFSGNEKDTAVLGKFDLNYNWDEAVRLVTGVRQVPKTFTTFEQMFYTVARFPNFRPETFYFENLDSVNRTRNKKRKVYAQFVEWIKSKVTAGGFAHLAGVPTSTPESFLPSIVRANPHLALWIESKRDEWQQKKIYSHHFNGELVREYTGLEGRALGDFIQSLKNAFGGDEKFRATILLSDAPFIKYIIQSYHLNDYNG